MTYDDLTCDNCGSYGDVICIDCKLSGNPDYCFCEDCIEEHMEMHGRPSFAQGECPNCGLDWTAHSDYIARGEKICWTVDEHGKLHKWQEESI